jgi:putative Mg2+ transporter-C (MgtC) family protein
MELDLFDANWRAQVEVAAKVVIAGFLAGLIGLEREFANRPAGLRTHALLGASAAMLVGVADLLVAHFVDESAASILRADPIRVVEAIVTGVAFLGAGTIFRDRDGGKTEGLTTAASMLLVASIGIAVALRQVILAVAVTVVTLILLRIVATVAEKTED